MEYFGITDKGRVRPTIRIFTESKRARTGTARSSSCATAWAAPNAGNVASRFAAECFVEEAKPALETGADEMTRHETLRRALDRANDTVFGLAGRQPSSAAWARRSSAPSCRAGTRAS